MKNISDLEYRTLNAEELVTKKGKSKAFIFLSIFLYVVCLIKIILGGMV